MNRCHFRLKEFVCLLSFCAVLVAVRAEGLQTDQQNAPTKPTKKNPMPAQTNPSPASQASYSPFDAISRKPTSEQFDASSLTACDEKNQSGQAVSFNDAVSSFVKNAETSDATCIIERVASAHSGSPTSMDLLADGNAVILHVMTWKRTLVKSTDPKYTGHTYQYHPDKGAWGFYRIMSRAE